MSSHCDVVEASFKKYDLIYSDADSLIYNIQHPVLIKWLTETKHHFDLSDSKRSTMHDKSQKNKVQAMTGESTDSIIPYSVSVSP